MSTITPANKSTGEGFYWSGQKFKNHLMVLMHSQFAFRKPFNLASEPPHRGPLFWIIITQTVTLVHCLLAWQH